MEAFSILSLPEDIQALVVERVASNSFEDLYRLGATCKSIKELTERPEVYASFDVFTLPWNVRKQVYDLLLQTCYANRNPSKLYIKGTQFFFNFNLQGEGLVLIKRSADAGFERALYTYAMIRKVFWDEEEYFSRFTRKSVERIGKLVRFHGITERPEVYASFDVFTLPWNVRKQVYDLLLQTCYANRNPSKLYIKGTQFFFNFNLQGEGLVLIKRSADAGFERALYTYAMIRKVFWDDEEYFSRFTRKSVERIGKLVRFHGSWSISHNAAFLTRKDKFMSNDVHYFYDCRCTPYEDPVWSPWYVENNKGKNMCNRCFWIRQLGLFYRDFEPVIAIPDTRLW